MTKDLDHAAKGEFKDKDASEKTWLQDGLALQLKIRETDLAKPHKATHKRRHRRAHQSTDATSLYPEVPIVSEARECAENFGQCSLEELLSVQHRKYFVRVTCALLHWLGDKIGSSVGILHVGDLTHRP